jgi:hypothetical protein
MSDPDHVFVFASLNEGCSNSLPSLAATADRYLEVLRA